MGWYSERGRPAKLWFEGTLARERESAGARPALQLPASGVRPCRDGRAKGGVCVRVRACEHVWASLQYVFISLSIEIFL